MMAIVKSAHPAVDGFGKRIGPFQPSHAQGETSGANNGGFGATIVSAVTFDTGLIG